MKKLLSTLMALALIAGAGVFFISDRDRAMWTLNSAIKLFNTRPMVSNIPYGDKPWQKLDVYPAQDTSTPAPVVVFIHGGSWKHGRKDQYFFAADAFLRHGYTVVLADYIKYPDTRAKFPSHIIDGAKAVSWVKSNIAKHNGDANNIFISGHSAGAHTTALLSADEKYLKAEGLSHADIRGFAGIAGPYAFTPDRVNTKAVFGPESNYPLMNPVNFVDGGEPSTLLLHSSADSQVGVSNMEKLAAKLQSTGGDIQTKLYDGLSHIDIVTHLHPWFAGENTVSKDIDAFFKSKLSKPNISGGLSD